MQKILLLLIVSLLSFSSSAQFTIIIDAVPENTPIEDDIFIAGDFQGWEPGNADYRLAKNPEGNIFSISLPVDIGDINFKFTRGDWSKVESDADGNFVPNRFYSPVEGDTLYQQILGWEDLNGNGGGQSTAAENVHIISDNFYMPQLDRYRRVWIYLPPDYEESTQDYPVLYMHDGQNVFDANTSYAGEWEVDETLNALHNLGDKGIIVVAVDNGGSLRINELTPWQNPEYGGGEGGLYIDFFVETLMPYINENYRTLSGAENTGIMGSSLGGLISLYAGIKYQDVFGKIGAFSPAYWINPEIFGFVKSTGKEEDLRIYQIVGTQEGEEYVRQMFEMQDTLLSVGFADDDVVSIEKSDGQHSEWFWAREFEDAYLWLFAGNATSIERQDKDEGSFRLYPNPVKDTFSIQFELNAAADVLIRITDASGKNVQRLFDQRLRAGKHHMDFSTQKWGIKSGNYICSMHIGQQIISSRFVVIE